MKRNLVLLTFLASSLVQADGINLSCTPEDNSCKTCPEYQTLFPIQEFTNNTDSLEIEADESEIINQKYFLEGSVEISSDDLLLSADNVEVSSENNSLLATGNVLFQDNSYLISSDILNASRDEEGQLVATATNANFQDFSAGLGGANGFTEIISKTPTSVVLTNSTYSLCPVNKNDWLIDSERIELNLDKNRGIADNAIIKFYGVPIFYMPKYSWVIAGRGSGFLTPHYSRYTDSDTVTGNNGRKKSSNLFRLPYYFNLAPDRDLLVAMSWMSSRGFVSEGKYRQLLAKRRSPEHADSIFMIDAKYLPGDKITNLKRWLLKFDQEFDITDKTHFSAKYFRVSDKDYFKDIARTNTEFTTLKSNISITHSDKSKELFLTILTEDEQVVNHGGPGYTRALEGSVSKIFNTDIGMPIKINLVSTKFKHDLVTKESGLRTHADLGISKAFNIKYPVITPSASVAITNYSLKTSPDINRTIYGSGLNFDFTASNPNSSMFGYKAIHTISPLITYNYKAKKVQGNIPIFDTTDKFDDIITFADLTSGERYTGLDRITNADDITLSLKSTHRALDAKDDDYDLLTLKFAQSFYTDDEVVSNAADTNFDTRKAYSDIAASIDIAVGNYVVNYTAQFNPDKSILVKKENSITYRSNPRKFITLSQSKVGIDGVLTQTEKMYGAYPLSNSIHLFGGLDKTTSTGIRNTETSGIAYESCCWAFRLAHFKEYKTDTGGYSFSTAGELILTGLGSSSSPLNGRIKSFIPGYKAKLN